MDKKYVGKVALVYPYFAHYREPVLRKLCVKEEGRPDYVLFSDSKSNISSLKTIDPEKATMSLDDGGLDWYFLKNSWLTKDILWQKGLLKLVLGSEFDVLILFGNMYYISTWVACLLARIKKKKIIMWTHGYLKNEKGLKGWLRCKFYRLGDSYLIYGKRAKNFMLMRGFDKDKIYIVNNSLNYEDQVKMRENYKEDELSKCRANLFERPELPIIITIGRLTSDKMVIDLANLTYELNRRGSSVNTLIIGDGPDRSKIEHRIMELGLEKQVVLYGACYDENQLAPMIMMSDICVMPGGIGLSCIHSLVYGTPVITHSNMDFQKPEVEAIVQGVSGDYFEMNNINELADVIQKWLNKELTREEIRKNCYSIIDQYYTPSYQKNIIDKSVNDVLTC